MANDTATDTTTTHYDAEGNETGRSVSHTEPSSNILEETINDSIQTGLSIATFGAVSMPGEESSGEDNSSSDNS
jgi:hypothetical protein